MLVGSVTSDLADIQWLLVSCLGAGLAILFRKELKAVLTRLNGVEAKRGDTAVRFELSDPQEPAPATEAGSPDPEDPQEQTEIAGSPPASDRETAQADDSAPKLRTAMFEATLRKEEEEADRLFQRLQEVEEDPRERKLDRARRHAVRFLAGIDGDSFEELKTFAADSELTSDVEWMLGSALQRVGQPAEAADAFLRCAQGAREPTQRARALAARGESLSAVGRSEEAIVELEEELKRADDPEAETELWTGLVAVFEARGESEQAGLARQQLIRLHPSDPELRFKAAYAYSDADPSGLGPVVIHLYGTVLRLDQDHEWAGNNMGAQLSRMDLKLLAIEHWMTAASDGNTLAMSNLAAAYLGAGFASDAEKMLDKAATEANPHQNISATRADLDRRRVEQHDQYQELKAQGERLADFLTEYSLARLRSADIGGPWRWDDGTLIEFQVKGGEIKASWEDSKKEQLLTGQLHGASARIKFAERDYLGFGSERKPFGWKDGRPGYLVVTEPAEAIELVELGDPPQYSTLRR